jgi:hypothetical protein
VSCAWRHTLLHAINFKTDSNFTSRLAIAFESNVIPVQDSMECAFYFMERSIDAGAVILSLVMARAFQVPCIPMSALRRFFEEESPATDVEQKRWEGAIHTFFLSCINKRLFCPAEASKMDMASNISCHITSPGGDGGREVNPQSLFRVAPPKTPGIDDNPSFKIGKRLWSQFPALQHVCQFISADVVGNTLSDMMDRWTLDLTGLLSSNIYDYANHFKKMGLHHLVHGISNVVTREKPSFARHMMIMDGQQTMAMAMGVDPFVLLLVVSACGGTLLHPLQAVSNMAASMVQLIAAKAPAGVVPGGPCLVSSLVSFVASFPLSSRHSSDGCLLAAYHLTFLIRASST